MDFGAKTQFDYLFDALANRYPGLRNTDGATSNFQFMETPMAAGWGRDDAEAYNLANSTSTRLDGFFAPGSNFAQAYQSLIMAMDPPDRSKNARYRKLIDLMATIDKQIQSLTLKAQGDFKLYVANNAGTQTTFAQWLADPFGGQTYQDQLSELRAQNADNASEMAGINKALGGPLGIAQGSVNPWSETMNITQGQKVQSVPLVTLGGDLAGDVAGWNRRPQEEYDFDVTIKANDTITSPWKTTYKTEVHSDCWGTSASLKTDTQRIITDNQYKLRICAVGTNSYKINRGQWFNPSLVTPSVKLVEGSAWTPDSFFGKQGALHLIPDEVFVMFRPTIKLTTSTEVYKQEIASNSDAEITYLNLMGFRFNVNGLASLQPVGDEKTMTVTFKAPENQAAQIVGIVSKVAWNGNDDS